MRATNVQRSERTPFPSARPDPLLSDPNPKSKFGLGVAVVPPVPVTAADVVPELAPREVDAVAAAVVVAAADVAPGAPADGDWVTAVCVAGGLAVVVGGAAVVVGIGVGGGGIGVAQAPVLMLASHTASAEGQ